MKKIAVFISVIIFTTIMVLITSATFAQSTNSIVRRDYVDYLVKTLSSDSMQGRATFTQGIDKAAIFIANEFKKIGLNSLPGEAGYRQTFYTYPLYIDSLSVTIDGQVVNNENILVLGSNRAQLTVDQNSFDGWIKLDTAKTFISQYNMLLRKGKKFMISLDPKFTPDFDKFKKNGVAGTLDEPGTETPSVLIFVIGREGAGKFKAAVKCRVAKLPMFNVAGVLPGKSKPNEFVVFSGHYDHLGIIKRSSGDSRDSIMNGANDDASGTSAVIALAKYFKKKGLNERTLIFVAFTAEEIGGMGSKFFSQQLNPEQVMAMFNIEMIGKTSKFGKNTAWITGFEKSDFGQILQKNLKGSKFSFHPDPYVSYNLFYRSDNATLAALGVPAHTICTDQIDTDEDYHQVSDEYNTLDVDNIVSIIKAIAKSSVSIVNGTDTPSRIPK